MSLPIVFVIDCIRVLYCRMEARVPCLPIDFMNTVKLRTFNVEDSISPNGGECKLINNLSIHVRVVDPRMLEKH